MAAKIIIIVVLIAFSGFFSATETAFSSVNRIRLKSMAENGSRRAERALGILKRYDKALTTILIGNNIVNIATSSIATVLMIAAVGEKYGSLVSTIATTLVVLTFGEILPKSIAKDFAESLCIAFSGILSFLMAIFTPFSAFFILFKKGISRIMHQKESVSVTEEELMAIIDEIEDEGVLEQQESDLVRSALQFDETTVDEIITPRVSITAAEINDSPQSVREKFLSEQYSRMPVYEKTLDNIVGIVTEKDFFREYEKNGGNITVRGIMQDTIYFPHMLRISEVLKKMQKHKCHMSVVLDQHGGTLGIVTMEDILEELVGEIWDESDEVKSPVTALGEDEFEVYGDVSLNSLRRWLADRDIDAPLSDEAHTVAGWVLELFGSIPKTGDVTETDDFVITVLDAAELRVNKIRVKLKRLPEKE